MSDQPAAVSQQLAGTRIAKRFGDRVVLGGVDLVLEPGVATAVVGPNGAGKSTLLRILAGLMAPDSGQVRLGERDLRTMSRRDIARHVAVVPQARPQVFDYSALELVLMGLHARMGRFALPSAAQERDALAAMAALEVDHLAGQSATVLSGGEMQRVLMARAMVGGAPVWLLDEPTASLDLKHQLAVLDQVRAHCARGGSALVIVHDLSLVHRSFDRVVVLAGGRVQAHGPPDDVLDEALVSRVFDVAMRRVDLDGRVVWVA